MRFIGREDQLAWLEARLADVRDGGTGQILSVRGRRQVGKSRLIEEFLRRSRAKAVWYTAALQPPAVELDRLSRAVAAAGLAASAAAVHGLGSWEGALALLAAEATPEEPVVLVIDELPYLAQTTDGIEAMLQAAWQRLERAPLLVVLVGSDVGMMESLSAYGRPLFGRLRDLVVPPFTPAETADRLDLPADAALDAYLVTGGMPRLAALWRHDDDLWSFLARELADATSPLLVLGERSIAAELPTEARARAVLAAIGSGERAFGTIGERVGMNQATLSASLDALASKRLVARAVPYSARGPGRSPRYLVADAYLRFWLRFLAEGIALVERGRSDVLLERLRTSWPTYRGSAIEPVVRASIERLLPDDRFGDARVVGAFWTRDGRVEVDLVGGREEPAPGRVAFVGSVKWRDGAPFGRDDLAALHRQRAAVPGADGGTLTVGVSRSGFAVGDLDVALGPDDLVAAWRRPGP